MACNSCHFPGTTGKVCNPFLPAKDKDFHVLCTSFFFGKCCTADDRFSDCHDWADKIWEKVSVYHEKLAI